MVRCASRRMQETTPLIGQAALTLSSGGWFDVYELRKVGLNIIKESLEMMNQFLRESGKRKSSWVVEKHVTKQLITSLGAIDYTKTLFPNKETDKRSRRRFRIKNIPLFCKICRNKRLLQNRVCGSPLLIIHFSKSRLTNWACFHLGNNLCLIFCRYSAALFKTRFYR